MEILMQEPSKEFLEKKFIADLKDSYGEKEHARKMEELVYARETAKLMHQWTLERGRISNAEQRKLIMLKNQEKK